MIASIVIVLLYVLQITQDRGRAKGLNMESRNRTQICFSLSSYGTAMVENQLFVFSIRCDDTPSIFFGDNVYLSFGQENGHSGSDTKGFYGSSLLIESPRG
jgi:hypothetical protein